MDINELVELQVKFDKAHRGRVNFFEEISDDNIHVLEHLIVCITGELGEFANVVKKITRGDFFLEDKREELSLELADIYIYLMKIFAQLDIDPEKAVLDKMAINNEKFKKLEI